MGHQRGNLLREEDYVSDPRQTTNVIVGSSMSQTLNDQILGPNFTKLTFPGNSVLTALEIILRSGKIPNLVLIETNVCLTEANPELLHDAFDPWSVELRNASPIFTEAGRPANFVGGIMEACVRRSCQIGSSFLSSSDEQTIAATPQKVPEEQVVQLKDVNMAEWDITPPAEILNHRASEIAKLVDELSRRGSHCILFNMPIDNTLATLAAARSWRRKMHEQFPMQQYDWLSFDESHHYLTSDGVHLIRSEANLVTKAMVAQIPEIVAHSNSIHRHRVAARAY
jgi:hypothetical protein